MGTRRYVVNGREYAGLEEMPPKRRGDAGGRLVTAAALLAVLARR